MQKILEIKNLTYDIPHSGVFIQDLNLEMEPGEFLGILGVNGAGKTTLLDLILGFRSASSGVIKVLGENPNSSVRQHKSGVVYLSHEAQLKSSLSVKEFLSFSSSFYPNYSSQEEKRLMEVFQLDQDQALGSLSTGLLKKVQYVAVASTKPQLLIIDEVTAVFDPESRELFFKELQILRSLGTTIVLATNIAEDLTSRVDRVLFIKNKKATFHSPEEISILFNLKASA